MTADLSHGATLLVLRRRLEARRSVLTERLEAIRRDLARAQGAISADFADQASEIENDQVLERLGTACEQELADVSRALRRLDAGYYDQCELCGTTIGRRRLEVLPTATRCRQCSDIADG